MRKQREQRSTFRDSMATYVSSLMAKRDFAAVIQYYEANRSGLTEAGGPAAGEILRQVATAYASLTNLSEALKVARMAQAMASADGDTPLLAEVFLTLGGILMDRGDTQEAERAFRDAESIFRRNDCPEGQSRALNKLAGLLFRQSQYRNALGVLMNAVELARKLDDTKKLAFMMGNIGRLQTFLGDFVDAEKHLRINVDLSSELGDDLEVARAQLSLGYALMQRADYAAAEAELDKCHGLIAVLNARREEVMYLTYLGELYYRTQRFDDARKVLTKALELAEESSSGTSLAARVMRHLAELYIRQGDYRPARRLAARALVVMQKVNDRVEVGALQKIMAQVADVREQADKARKLFQQAIDLLDQSGVRWEKAEAMVAAGSSAAFSERERMTYLFRAEEIFASSRNAVRHEEVGRLISEIGPLALPHKAAKTTEVSVDYITQSPVINKFKSQLPMLGKTDLPILMTGETGVGKDRLARFFHTAVCPDAPFVAINCASVPETLLESELFGYCKGAFTGASQNKPGLFVAANGGVLMLDEIGDMPLSLQAKLLGVLENRTVMPLGGTKEVPVDIILVAATNRNLEEMVEQGTFRRDLYYRLTGVTMHLPALRERREDIPLLLQHFMSECGLLKRGDALPMDLVRQFMDYDWPGNIRELQNRVKRLEVMRQMVAEGDLAELARSMFNPNDQAGEPASLFERVEEFERRLITEALLAARGNKSQAARMLGIHEATVRTKLKRYNIELPFGAEQSGGALN
ncbi:tetratricopeptide repeat protein [candidate division GN15 bacterium]|nr:tetratricopeptide repeat protein [candidate division GN15 bacterium]